MFPEQDKNDIIKHLKTKNIVALDLSLPIEIVVVEEPQLAQTLGELDVRSAYDRLSLVILGSIDLAGVNKYLFRKTKHKTGLKSVVKGHKFKLLDAASRIVFVANPNVFFPIFPSQWDVRPNIPAFHQFGNLPDEIRHKIWALAAEPRHLVATEDISRRWFNELAPWIPGSDFHIEITRTSVTEVCSEAREVLVNLGVYKVVRYQHRRSRIVEYFIMNPETDTLEINSTLPYHGFSPRFTLSGPTMNPAFGPDLMVITRLTLKVDHLRSWNNWASRTVAGMGSLQALKIWEEVEDDTIVYPYQLFLDFMPPELDSDEILPIFGVANQTERTGAEAIRLIGRLMGHEIEDIDDDLYSIWGHITRFYRAIWFFLPLVQLDLSFWPSDDEYCGLPRVIESGNIR